MNKNIKIRHTTIIAVSHQGNIAMGGDGQVSFGETIMKRNAIKIRKIYHGKIITGFAGATADALTLFERFEEKIEKYQGNISRASVELAKDWRTDKILRRLEAFLLVGNKEHIYIISGNGDVIEPDDGVIGIGSGGQFATAAAKALIKFAPNLSAKQIVEEALKISASICVYTNENFVIETL